MDAAFDRLATDRLVLRRFRAGDAVPLAGYRSVPEVARFQSWDAPYPVERAALFIEWLLDHHPDEPGEWYQLAIATREQPELLIGDCAFCPDADEPAIARIGFTLSPEAQGRGYATEAVGALLRYLFDDRGKHRVAADCDARNAASAALLRRLGFRQEGWLRDALRDADGWADELLFALLEDDWRAGLGRS